MKIRLASLTFGALAASLLLAGCGPEPKPAAPAAAAATPPPAPPPATQYDAEAFFATTSYQMPAGYAWSADDKQLLVSSDETGIFNVYALTAAAAGKRGGLAERSGLAIRRLSEPWRACLRASGREV